MDALYDIEKMSLTLILYCLRETDFIEQYNFVFCDIETNLGDALQFVADAFAGSYHNLYSIHSFESLNPVEFAQKSISICLKICSSSSPLHILLACAFLTEYVSHLAMDRNCFKITSTAWKCLTVIINRKIKNVFEDPTRWQRFKSYLIKFVESVRQSNANTVDAICPDPICKEQTTELVLQCREIGEDYDLTPEEKAIFTTEATFEEERENIENLPECGFCHEPCSIFLSFCWKKHRTAYVENYKIMRSVEDVLNQIHFNAPSSSS